MQWLRRGLVVRDCESLRKNWLRLCEFYAGTLDIISKLLTSSASGFIINK